MKSAELQERQLTERMLWLLAAGLAAMFTVVVVLYRKLRVTNTLLGQKNRGAAIAFGHRPADVALQPAALPGFHRRGAARRRPAAPGHGRRGAGRAPDRPRPLQVDQRSPRACGRRRRARRDVRAIAPGAARGGHDRALGRRGVPRLRAGRVDRPARRHRAADHGHDLVAAGRCIAAPRCVSPRRSATRRCRCRRTISRSPGNARWRWWTRRSTWRSCTAAIAPTVSARCMRSEPEALDAALGDLEAAWNDGVVDMRVLINGPRPVSTALPPDFDLAA